MVSKNYMVASFKKNMGKIEKKRQRLEERITFLEDEMKKNLIQKTSNTKEISVSDYVTKINDLKKQLINLK